MKNQENPAIYEQGNVFFLILIAIVLFAGVLAVINRGGRTNESVLSTQQAKLMATDLMSYLNAVKTGFNMLTVNGCNPVSISYVNNLYKRIDNVTSIESAPPGSTSACSMFQPEGAGVKPVIIAEAGNDDAYNTFYTDPSTIKAMHFQTRYIDTQEGTSANDIAHYTNGVKPEVCKAFLALAGAADPDNIPVYNFTTPTSNSYTPGTAGSLTPMAINAPPNFFALKLYSSVDFCTFGIVLRKN